MSCWLQIDDVSLVLCLWKFEKLMNVWTKTRDVGTCTDGGNVAVDGGHSLELGVVLVH